MIRTSANQFVADVRKLLPQYETSEIININQSGIQLELHSSRILSHEGEKVTVGSVRSINATTRSYTVKLTITLDGHLLSPLYLSLKEPKGHTSENIRLHLFNASNVVITCSSSGKLTTSMVEYWRDHVLLSSLENIRSFHSSRTVGVNRLMERDYTIISPGAQGFKYQRKRRIPRRLYDRVLVDELDVNMSEQNNIIRLISLTHNQLSSEVFRPMTRYAWYASGYTDNHHGSFETVAG
ncbi:unnamed protein product, partial [Adineta ricciae]